MNGTTTTPGAPWNVGKHLCSKLPFQVLTVCRGQCHHRARRSLQGDHPDPSSARNSPTTGSSSSATTTEISGFPRKFPAAGYTLTDMATDNAELINALALRSAHIAAQSMGGMSAITHPETVRSLALIYTAAHPDLIRDIVADRTNLPPAGNRAEAIENFILNEAPDGTKAYPLDEA